MSRKKKKSGFPIEKKLAAIEWKLELLRASVTTTHTPLRTLKSMVQTDIILPTRNLLKEIIESPLHQKTGSSEFFICKKGIHKSSNIQPLFVQQHFQQQ